jgi:hypothetical protein
MKYGKNLTPVCFSDLKIDYSFSDLKIDYIFIIFIIFFFTKIYIYFLKLFLFETTVNNICFFDILKSQKYFAYYAFRFFSS